MDIEKANNVALVISVIIILLIVGAGALEALGYIESVLNIF